MMDFKALVEKIKSSAFQRGSQVDAHALEEQLKSDEKKLRMYKQVFSTPEGRLVLLDLMREGGILASTNTNDSLQLAIQAGKRHMATYIAEYLALNLEQVIQSYMEI